MMGSRGYGNGFECDAFSRKSRRLVNWRAGELRKLKRAFAKRTRRLAACDAKAQAKRQDV